MELATLHLHPSLGFLVPSPGRYTLPAGLSVELVRLPRSGRGAACCTVGMECHLPGPMDRSRPRVWCILGELWEGKMYACSVVPPSFLLLFWLAYKNTPWDWLFMWDGLFLPHLLAKCLWDSMAGDLGLLWKGHHQTSPPPYNQSGLDPDRQFSLDYIYSGGQRGLGGRGAQSTAFFRNSMGIDAKRENRGLSLN